MGQKKWRPRATAVAINAEVGDLILATAGAGGFAVTLPTVGTRAGDEVVVKKVDAGVGLITTTPQGASLIDGAATDVLTDQWDCVRYLNNGTDWFAVGASGKPSDVTLQDGYDNNPLITTTDADGDIIFAKGGTTVGDEVLTVRDASAIASTAALVAITNTGAGRTTGPLLAVSSTNAAFIGDAVNVTLTGNSLAAQALVLLDNGGGINAEPLVEITSTNDIRTAAALVSIANAGDAFTGDVLAVAITAASACTTGQGLTVSDAGTGANTAALVEVTSTNAARTTGALVSISQIQDAFVGDALAITLGGTGVTKQALVIAENAASGANTAAFCSIISANAARVARAPLLQMTLAAASEATCPYFILSDMAIFCDTGVPNNANGNNGDLYIDRAGAAAAKLYSKDAGAWVAI